MLRRGAEVYGVLECAVPKKEVSGMKFQLLVLVILLIIT